MKFMLGSAIALTMIAGVAIAEPGPHGGPGGATSDRGMPTLPLKRADVPALVAREFAEIDANHDGGITEAEIRAFRRARMQKMMKAHRDRTFAMLDANGDGSLSRAEFDAPPPPPGHDNGGAGAKQDMPPPPPGGLDFPEGSNGPRRHGLGGGMGHGPGGGMMPIGGHAFERADANQDGKVTLAEAQAAALAWFDAMDANHDGVVDQVEIRAMMWAHMRGGHGRSGPGGPDSNAPPPPPRE